MKNLAVSVVFESRFEIDQPVIIWTSKVLCSECCLGVEQSAPLLVFLSGRILKKKRYKTEGIKEVEILQSLY